MYDSFPKALVTGASGLVGNNIVRELLKSGIDTRVLLRRSADPATVEGLDVEVLQGDIRDAAAVETACCGVSLIVHAAALVKIGGFGLGHFREINTEGTRNIVKSATAHQARFVYVSTSDTVACNPQGHPASENSPFDREHATCYSISKHEAENVVVQAVGQGLNGVIVNPSFMLGPWDWKPSSGAMLSAVGRGLGFVAPDGFGCFADVRDVTSGILAAAERGERGERYLLTGETLSYYDAWKLFAEVSGRKPPFQKLGPLGTGLAGRAGDLLGSVTGHEPSVNSTALNAAKCPRLYSNSRAESELGYQTRPLRDTVIDAWQWLQEFGN